MHRIVARIASNIQGGKVVIIYYRRGKVDILVFPGGRLDICRSHLELSRNLEFQLAIDCQLLNFQFWICDNF